MLVSYVNVAYGLDVCMYSIRGNDRLLGTKVINDGVLGNFLQYKESRRVIFADFMESRNSQTNDGR